jgi:hypothetical protein
MYVCSVGCQPAIPADPTLLGKLLGYARCVPGNARACNSLQHGGRNGHVSEQGAHTLQHSCVCGTGMGLCCYESTWLQHVGHNISKDGVVDAMMLGHVV